MEQDGITRLENLVRQVGGLAAFLALLLSGFLSPFGLDTLAGAYALLGAAFVFALARWIVWTLPPEYGKARGMVLKSLVLLLISACAVGWGYFLWWASQPHFEITALDTLEGDRNAYELTDQLIWNQDVLDQNGVGITFTLEIVPRYFGRQNFGRVIALISGDSDNPPLEKLLWDGFKSGADPQHVQLTLPELLYAAGLRQNSNPSNNPFRPGDISFQQAKVLVQVARAARKQHAWSTEEIAIRNAPWEVRSALVQRQGRREADVYVKNLGGAGGFTVRYRLARLEEEIGTSSQIELSGTTDVDIWNEPEELVYLQRGEFFTDTVSLPDQLAQGRYILELYAVKKQNYVQFAGPNARWENLNSLESPWWFGEYPPDKHGFVVPTSEIPIDLSVEAEWQRMKDELGLVIRSIETLTAANGTEGLRQAFQNGEVYVHDGQGYALYGPILEHYRDLGGVEYNLLGFPTSPIQPVTSVSGADGYMAEFESKKPHAPTLIYASSKGVAEVQGWIDGVYREHGGHEGWLGFPLADMQHYSDSVIQMFEGGYIVYAYPYVGGERDWGRKPVAYPYLASRGTLLDVHAEQLWQDTGVQVQAGDDLTILQVAGEWTYRQPDIEMFDANGNRELPLQANAPLPSAPVGTLIGRIGEDGSPVFSVGRWGVYQAPVGGKLYLAMNDNGYGDNAGFITVQIMVEHPE